MCVCDMRTPTHTHSIKHAHTHNQKMILSFVYVCMSVCVASLITSFCPHKSVEIALILWPLPNNDFVMGLHNATHLLGNMTTMGDTVKVGVVSVNQLTDTPTDTVTVPDPLTETSGACFSVLSLLTEIKTGDETADTGDTASDTGKETGKETGDTASDTGKETGDTASDTGKETGDTVSDTGKETGDTVSDTASDTDSSVRRLDDDDDDESEATLNLSGKTSEDSDTGDTPPDDTGDTPPDDTGDTPPDDTGDTPSDDTGDTSPDDTGDTPPDDTGDTPPDDTVTESPLSVLGESINRLVSSGSIGTSGWGFSLLNWLVGEKALGFTEDSVKFIVVVGGCVTQETGTNSKDTHVPCDGKTSFDTLVSTLKTQGVTLVLILETGCDPHTWRADELTEKLPSNFIMRFADAQSMAMSPHMILLSVLETLSCGV
eukprot:Blabericola_migrator_1__5525@NODE_2819_length_2319_cov_180_159414_g1768_i0_p2_GENE_NODE_2819_length_2319_cov_180_159414_g1768_i0NODE_2819_length_2319_cov_180_159414_g1768_i0_p2_ORF_typecomplete_len431_score163_54YtxH/PF12732_7/0_0041BUD22/PF09073_10/0_0027DUF883/PF05957_13/0_0054_NODE_2819_length_2319_cov_180_159414_g1768_i03021594